MRRIPRYAAAGLPAAAALLAQPGEPASAAAFPRHDHVLLIIMANQTPGGLIGNPAAPELTAPASDYGLAASYTGAGDPREPNCAGMLAGSTFGLSDDNPYSWPGHTQNAANPMSRPDSAGRTWKGYPGGLPHAGCRGYCCPEKGPGIPDSDPLHASKHNGIANFANPQNPAGLAKMTPVSQLPADPAAGTSPNLGYIVPDMCHDMHGAPPYRADSGSGKSAEDTWLTAAGDAHAGQIVRQIRSPPVWPAGNTAIVVTFDEGSPAAGKTATIAATSRGPRGVKGNTAHDHYSPLAGPQQTSGLGCLLNSCAATPMTPLFQITGPATTPAPPAPYTTPPTGGHPITAAGRLGKGTSAARTCAGGWHQAPGPGAGNPDSNLDAASAASATDAWAAGDYYPSTNPNVFQNTAEHWDGSAWAGDARPEAGSNQNTLLGVSELPSGRTWAVGCDTGAGWTDQTLIEHYDGSAWSVAPGPSPGARRDILTGVAAISDNDVWAAGGQMDSAGARHTLAGRWDGTGWSTVPTADPGAGGSEFFGAHAASGNSVYAVGDESGAGFPGRALIGHWDGSEWPAPPSPAGNAESLTAYGAAGSDTALTVAGNRGGDTAPFTALAASGAPGSLALATTPSATGENNLYAVTTAADGSTYAAGWSADPGTGVYLGEIPHGVNGQWSIDTTPNPGSGSNGFAGVAAVPGGGVWAVGVTSDKASNSTLIAHHC